MKNGDALLENGDALLIYLSFGQKKNWFRLPQLLHLAKIGSPRIFSAGEVM